MNRLFSRADWTRQKFLLPANGSAHICNGDMQYNASTYESAAAVPRFQQQVPLPISSSIITRKNRRCSLSLASSEKQKHPAIESVAGSLSPTRVPCASRGKRNEGLRRTVRIPCLASAWPPKDQSGKTRKPAGAASHQSASGRWTTMARARVTSPPPRLSATAASTDREVAPR